MIFEIICIIALVVIVLLTLKIVAIRKSISEITNGVNASLKTDTNQVISLTSGDKKMRALASELNTLLIELREEKIRCERGDNQLKEAITNISHDLRTPLTAICGYLDLLKKEEKTEQVNRYTDMISNRTDALKNLTEELFTYSATVTEDKEPVLEEISLNSAIESIMGEYYAALIKAEITPEIILPEKQVKRFLDKQYVSRIFGNIISNVIKYSEGDMTIILSESGRICFKNTAPNMDNISVGKLFDRFFTIETARGSTGLGLSIAKLLCERIGGNISAEYADSKLSIIVEFP